MKTIDRLLIQARKLKMQVKKIPPVVCDTFEQAVEFACGYDKRYGKDRWSTVFIYGEDLLEDDGVKIENKPTVARRRRR